jgi:glutamine synthetase
MPKPIYGINGSGMHTNQSLFDAKGKNVFYDADKPYQLSELCRYYIGGLLKHATDFCAVTNPLVNSYKRLVPGHEAPTHIAWSMRNRSPLIRVPARRENATRAELRMPDPACNPYLAIAVMLASGLDGIENKIDPGEPVHGNIYEMSTEEYKRANIRALPANLNDAIRMFEKSHLMRKTLGEHIFTNYITAKHQEWNEYIAQVHPWEIEQYLGNY